MRDQRRSLVGSTPCGRRWRRSRIGLLVAAGASLTLTLAGCQAASGNNPATPSPSPVPTSAPATAKSAELDTVVASVRWMDGFCGTVNDFLADNNKIQPPPNADFRQLLDEYAAILDKAVAGLNALPPAPVPAGEAAKKTYLEKYTSARNKVTSAKTQLHGAADDDIAAHERASDAFVAAQEEALTALDPVGTIGNSPELIAAAGTAPRCTEIGVTHGR